jgi:predicted RNA polymerase sigma factor
VAEGVEVLRRAMQLTAAPGSYVLQAQVAALHSTARTAEDTD